ncbi:ATPase, T2SS/T4P/T4SS family [Pollutimonas bauzanensis]|uniref:Type II secretory pathway ATPase GspE/PulE or T4P pilus assembly pathway ATPase PilB n=1 Tax=Pollutimonas bauzanensis TaxID=658167 RepID=A0A1M5YHI5_9BURK|nr:ATPase, T2SS/T4P/T4SS family [Pollutimonas bauzanensis]SHI11485.1 Type II secretory pathway ATPase GspE/PulE or T4P pilus assembly pathway ATPase PilB [Pollutimonas bauzanensis]
MSAVLEQEQLFGHVEQDKQLPALPELPELPPITPVSPQELTDPAQSPAPQVILSAIDGHDYHASPAVRAKAALADNGILYLAEGARSDVLVISYIAALDRRKALSDGEIVPYSEVRVVPYTEIQRLYAESTQDAAGAETATRRTAEESQAASIIAEAAQGVASDVFVENYEAHAEIHYRIAGDIERRFAMQPDRAKQLIRTIYDSMCEATDPFYDPSRDQGGRIARRHTEGLGLHQVRVSTGPTDEDRPFMALRLHYDLGEPRSLVELGFTPEQEAMVIGVTNYSSGIVLFSGPTGSGKSTSLANLIGYCQKRDNCRRKVISLEDPPEIPIFGAVQKAVLRKGLDREAEGQAWIAGFETLMRWNPDWIIAGELRLRETMDAALKAALTNHLTWGMLHASSATLVPTRLQEAGIEMGYLSDPEIFRLFANQSLVAKLCPHCSITYARGRTTLSPGLVSRIEKHCTPDTVRLRGRGCEHCYRGVLRVRTICAEVLNTDHSQLSVYRRQGAMALRRYWVRERGGKTKAAHMIDKINAGEIDPVDAERIVLPLDADDPLWEDEE